MLVFLITISVDMTTKKVTERGKKIWMGKLGIEIRVGDFVGEDEFVMAIPARGQFVRLGDGKEVLQITGGGKFYKFKL